MRNGTLLVLGLAGLVGCTTNDAASDGRDDSFTTAGKLDGFQCTPQEAAAILQVANTASRATLKNDVELADKAVDNILAYRAGDDEHEGTADDEEFGSLGELDAVPYIGPTAFQKLLDYVHAADLVANNAPRQWNAETVANGASADFTVAPNGKPVSVFLPAGSTVYKLRQASGTVIDLPADAKVVGYNGKPYVAVDSSNAPHVFYMTNTGDAAWKHASYRNGAWTQHAPIEGSYLKVDNGPGGQIFVLEHRYANVSSSYDHQYTLHTIAANGGDTPETLWRGDGMVALNVDADGFPSVLWEDGTVRNGRRTSAGWQTRDTGYTINTIQGLATTGGASPAVFVDPPTYAHDLHLFRQVGSGFVALDPILHQDNAHEMDAVLDSQGIAHMCMVDRGNIFHIQVDAAGGVTKDQFASADTCWLGLDTAGKVHMMYSLGSVINHAVYE